MHTSRSIRIEFSHLDASSIDLLADMLLACSDKFPSDVLMKITELPNEKESITIPVSPGGHAPTVSCMLPLSDILYVIADRHYVRIWCPQQTFRCRLCFSELVSLLPPDRFILSSRGILVNKDQILSCSRTTCTMSDHTLLPISRSNRDSFVRFLTAPQQRSTS